ncbi:hypothetical protein M409DRAFT_28421 [Zasmidium cellare ATCC 36951]|uniref:RBR-type E3 ubiquitin transferase n=1 Tax=Zasmidium cellare ATCC 36951 TaxID=1080233 RepID=A0A6A6C4I2_ZASCE|nr:uncharacterized protein M409DRAFT_28421 [Zasmidium cellare ATCC 36951]KAF2161090.1 hypothetical protein M409DRAFT_28421 [Zasmidium cellare ATCC 36951]
MEDERIEELGSLTAIFPELIIDPTKPFTATLELPITPTTPLLARFMPTVASPTETYADAATNGAAHIEKDVRLTQLPPLTLHLDLPEAYPNDAPPQVKLTTQHDWLPKEKLAGLEVEVATLWEEYGHCQILFSYIDYVQQAAERGFDFHQSSDGCLILPAEQESKLVAFAIQKEQETFNKGTYDCGICLEPKKGSACYRMKRCGHVFCRLCLQDFYNNAITEGNVTGVACLDPDCGALDADGRRMRVKKHRLVHPRELLAMGIEESTVRRYVEMKRKKKLESDKTTVYCPRTWCNGPAKSDKYPPIPADLTTYVDNEISDDSDDAPDNNDAPANSQDSKKAIDLADRLAVCEKCQLAFCRVCYHGWHGQYVRCYPRNPDELSAEERASYDYIAKHTSPCSYCNAPTSKTHGCNHMHCTQCSTHFCYLCGFYLDPQNPYLHFNTAGTTCYQRLWELEEGDDGQAPRDGQGFLGPRHWEQEAAEADAAEAEAAAAQAQAEENNRILFPDVPEPPHNDMPIMVAMAQFDWLDLTDEEDEPPRNARQRGARRQRNAFPQNAPARGGAQAVRNHERGRGGGRGRGGQAGGGNRQDLEQRRQAELQRFLALAERDEEEGWDSDELGNDDEDFIIPRR